MAFFDKISKTVTEASQKTIAKTKELADTSRLNSMISEQEKFISNQYFQIGKLYASIHMEDFEEPFSGMIAAIADAEAKIRDFKQQIQDIKGIRRCENCGAEVTSGAAFCSACGYAMPKVEAFDTSIYEECVHCGAVIKKGMRFCTACGKRLIEDPPVPDTPATLPASPVCAQCGSPLSEGMKFCTICGAQVGVPEPVVIAEPEDPNSFCINCGAELKPGMVFCTKCGMKV